MTIYNHTFTSLGNIVAHPNYIENIPKEFDELIHKANKIENDMERSAVLGVIYLSVLRNAQTSKEIITTLQQKFSDEISDQHKAD